MPDKKNELSCLKIFCKIIMLITSVARKEDKMKILKRIKNKEIEVIKIMINVFWLNQASSKMTDYKRYCSKCKFRVG